MAEDELNLCSILKITKKINLFEMIHATIVGVENVANDKNELKKIFLKDVPTEVYPKIEKALLKFYKVLAFHKLN